MKNFIIILTLLFAGSCAKISYLQLLSSKEQMLKSAGGYEAFLALEYLSFARRLVGVNDLKTAEYFAKKGLDIEGGKSYSPENPITWKGELTRMSEFILMQKKLENLINNQTLIFQLPIQMAHLSYLYDCYVSKESKAIFRADELSNCRVNFVKLVDELESFLNDLNKDKTPEVKIVEPEFTRFEVIFDAENYILNEKGQKQMLEIVDYLKTQGGRFRLIITGNPDNAIKEKYNLALVKNRIFVVKNYLIKNGVDENIIQERIESEDFPDIIANDEVENQLNRSVGVYVISGDLDFKPYPLPLLQNLLYKAQIENAKKEIGIEQK